MKNLMGMEGDKSDMVSQDQNIMQPFDTIEHCRLLHSLADLHVRRPLWLIVRSYLSNREQRVKWGSCVSNSFPVSAGVPQGGLLSPLLFVICINSLDSYLPPSVIPVKYADDLTITEFLMGSLPGLTQKALDSVVEWGQEFTLAMNGVKTVDMTLTLHTHTATLPWNTHFSTCGHIPTQNALWLR
uniref:Reverse transcriptase domain-containing protein n=1 Tax=Sinocyclocheilus anshuiensis TaxID=1608454 RepID=A0A671KTR0_9TELE